VQIKLLVKLNQDVLGTLVLVLLLMVKVKELVKVMPDVLG
jgi:hypothetical protein